jgi:hypothetical protein
MKIKKFYSRPFVKGVGSHNHAAKVPANRWDEIIEQVTEQGDNKALDRRHATLLFLL